MFQIHHLSQAVIGMRILWLTLNTPVKMLTQAIGEDLTLQSSNLISFRPEILKKSNHIRRNCKNADIENLMYGILDLTIPRLSFYEFEKFLFLPTLNVVSMIQKLKSNGRVSLHGLTWSP